LLEAYLGLKKGDKKERRFCTTIIRRTNAKILKGGQQSGGLKYDYISIGGTAR
jgi:hypothetical protein